MSAIASQLGGSKGTLWSYFPSKELLFEAVLDRATRQFREEMRLTLNPDDPVPDALGKFAEAIIGKMSGDEAITLHRLVVGEAGRFPEMGRIYYRRAPEPTLGLLSDYLSEVMDRGFLRREDPFLAAQNLIGLCHAPSHLRRLTGVATPPTAETTAREANDAVRLFLRAYAPD